MFSDYVVYVDESGDPSLTSINPDNPMFVLTFCIFEKEKYRNFVVPEAQKIKFEFWGHDGIIFHGHEIRKSRGDFNILLNETVRQNFMSRINGLIQSTPVTLIAAVIDKGRHIQQYRDPANPYEIALTFCMERLQRWLKEQQQSNRKTFISVECRGKKEDAALELEFRRIADGGNEVGIMPNLDIRFMDKKHNSTGLQIADLLAYPIARHVINPNQSNRAYNIIEQKFRRSNVGVIKGYGLKIFP